MGERTGSVGRMRMTWRIGAGAVGVLFLATCVGESGTVMEDAGEILVDVGRSLIDGGSAVDDALDDGLLGDAAALDCATCTTGGAARTTSADADPTRWVGGTISGGGGAMALETGPFYLTDVALGASRTAGIGPSSLAATVFIAPAGAGCDTSTGRFVVHLAWYDNLGSNVADFGAGHVAGARVLVAAGETLCVGQPSGGGSGWSFFGGDLSWSGFRPYD